MSTVNPCLPPPNTAPGSVHVLRMNADPKTEREWHWRGFRWFPYPEGFDGASTAFYMPSELAACGWRYVGPAKDAAHE